MVVIRLMMRISLVVLGCCTTVSAIAQPSTEIFLYDLKIRKGKISLRNGQNITNHPGYDNQPFFHPDEPILYYVSADEGGATDIYEYNFDTRRTTHVTSTKEREYSPTVMPGKKYLSCIIQRENGAQDLSRYPLRGGEAEVLVDSLTVGYHAWADPSCVALFVLPQPFTLHVFNTETRASEVIAERIGRSLHAIPGTHAISFLQEEEGVWYIRRLDVKTKAVSTITRSLDGEDHDMCWLTSGSILMTKGNKLYHWRTDTPEWQELTELDPVPARTVSRLAVHPSGKKIALVVSEE